MLWIGKRLKGVKKRDNRLVVSVTSDYSDKNETKEISQQKCVNKEE